MFDFTICTFSFKKIYIFFLTQLHKIIMNDLWYCCPRVFHKKLKNIFHPQQFCVHSKGNSYLEQLIFEVPRENKNQGQYFL